MLRGRGTCPNQIKTVITDVSAQFTTSALCHMSFLCLFFSSFFYSQLKVKVSCWVYDSGSYPWYFLWLLFATLSIFSLHPSPLLSPLLLLQSLTHHSTSVLLCRHSLFLRDYSPQSFASSCAIASYLWASYLLIPATVRRCVDGGYNTCETDDCCSHKCADFTVTSQWIQYPESASKTTTRKKTRKADRV